MAEKDEYSAGGEDIEDDNIDDGEEGVVSTKFYE